MTAYEKLTTARRTFVDGVLGGETATAVMRAMRPRLKRPDVAASKWMRRVDVRAAIAERPANTQKLELRVAELERQIGRLWNLQRLPLSLIGEKPMASPSHPLGKREGDGSGSKANGS